MTAPSQDHRCVRCDADLTVSPHFKLCWHGVPRALNKCLEQGHEAFPCEFCAPGSLRKGDLCDPCHEVWKAEQQPQPGLITPDSPGPNR